MGYKDHLAEVEFSEKQAEIKLFENNRRKNRAYFEDFFRIHTKHLANDLAWREDEITVTWHGSFVTLTLCGYDQTSMIVETGSDWPKFKTDLEMGYENLLRLQLAARQKAGTCREKKKYLDLKKRIYGLDQM